MTGSIIRRLCRAALACASISLLLLSTGCDSGFTAAPYPGREDGAKWRQAALKRIEKIRKGDLVVEVVDVNGIPVPGAQVTVTMQRHAFAFGSAVAAYFLNDPSADGVNYRKVVEMNFNKVVFENDLKWAPWEESLLREPGSFYNVDNTFAALKWLRERDIKVRGHYVAWGSLDGDSGTTAHALQDGAGFRADLLKHAEDEVLQIGDLVSEWDVVNHPIGWGPKTITDIAGADIYDVLFRDTGIWNPHAVLCINEGGVLPHSGRMKQNGRYFRLIRDMLGRGVPVQEIGFMGHFFAEQDLTPPVKLLKILDRYATLGLPLQVTEFDVRFGNQGEFITLTPEQERLQADYTRDFLIAMFSHPSVVGVVTWGFWEGRDWYPSAAMYRKNWSIKPNGQAWEDLVKKQWWTNAAGVTDSDGRFAARGFLGDYTVEAASGVLNGSTSFSLGAPGTSVRVVVQ